MHKQHNVRVNHRYTLSDSGMKLLTNRLLRLNEKRLKILEQIRQAYLVHPARPHRFADKIHALQRLDDETYRLETILAGARAREMYVHSPIHAGSRIRLRCDGKDVFISLVAKDQVDVPHGLLPIDGDLGRLLIGKLPGSHVTLVSDGVTPKTYEVIAIDNGP